MGTGRGSSTTSLPSFFSSSPPELEMQQALVPVVKKLVLVRRPVWGQLCLHPLRPQQLRCAPRHLQKEGGGQTLGHCPLRDTTGSPGPCPKLCAASPQGHSAPTGPGPCAGPAAAGAALLPAAGPGPAHHLAPPPALPSPAAPSVSPAPACLLPACLAQGVWPGSFDWHSHLLGRCHLDFPQHREPRYSTPGSTPLY